jgi:hypothetical protein
MPLNFRTVQSPDPAAGAEAVFTADEDMVVVSVSVTLVTSATVANRTVQFVADDGTNISFRSTSTQPQTASATANHSAFAGAAFGTGTNTVYTYPLPAGGLKLKKGDRLRTITALLDAGDNYGPMTLMTERE